MTPSEPPPPVTLREALDAGAEDAAAVVTPEGAVLTHGQLRSEVDRLSSRLRAFGLGAGSRVAIVLPNGPEMAVAFLAAACVGCAAPLNPRYRAAELRFYLEDLAADALITRPDESGAEARAAAQHIKGGAGGTSGTNVLALALNGAAADGPGSLDFCSETAAASEARRGAARPRPPTSDDVALVLHTSGTTSRPKIVPLRQRNLACSATGIAASLALGPEDRSLQVMPLFHIHGLLAGLLAPLSAGASVACTEGFDAFRFFTQLQELRPSYYTAVPTMHQMVLSRADRHRGAARAARLRFVRSSSASLPAPVLVELAELFEAPVVEAYGMTEATHQMCANPLPPAVAKPRSVGIPAGVELAILDPQNRLLPSGGRGEVSIKGPAVIDGYENNPEADAAAFSDGWFRTGDEGYLDDDGYLFLTGRFKEQINRGGEKISPLEVDEALLAHPKVAQAVTFALAHTKLGEEVAAAVVLVSPADPPDERELRRFVAQSLAAFKVPRRIVVTDELPKGATGKLQRIGLAERLGLAAASEDDS
ncbi:MAG: AMP-binding protein [Acidimicrobiaceae bacterium]|nr:AMP-binding protein [Acidimicrobiaceae bacterium]MCY4280478.1 AMP-binding protein [Acidimicrobiaceae bacterium]MCY4294839.1 AMP-binding protein [Acidimicrobiaceae bacterium]